MKSATKLFFCAIVLLVACSTLQEVSETTLQTEVAVAIEQTQISFTNTPSSTNTPLPRATPQSTSTPRPTFTPTPKPRYDNSPKTINEVIMGEQYFFNFPTITIYDVEVKKNIGNSEPKAGNVYTIVRMRIKNSGGIGSYGYGDFVAVVNGVFVDPESFVSIDCELGFYVEVMDGATLDKCIVFEVPPTSTFTVIYAPYANDPYNPERSLQWEIKLR